MSVWALGLGPARITAVLGQSLDATVPLRFDAGEDLGLECIDAKVFFGDDRLGGSQVRLRLDSAPQGAGARVLHIATTPAVNEPVVSIVVTAGCSAAVAREFVAFADPPSTAKAAAPAAASAAEWPEAVPARAGRHSEARPPLNQSGSAGKTGADAAPPARRALASSSAPATRTARPVPTPTKPSSAIAKPAVRPAPSLARLRLEAPLPATGAKDTPRPAETSAAARPLAEPGAMPAQATAEAARLQTLEATLAEVRREMVLTRRSLEVLESRARETESARQDGLWAYGLAGLAAALAAAIGWLLMERRRDRAAAAWDRGLAFAAAPETAPDPEAPPAEAPWVPDSRIGEKAGPQLWPDGGAGNAADGALVAPPAPLPDAVHEAERPAGRSSALEELLDLDQQLAFLDALGQEEAALGVLTSHVEQAASSSPLPWLELLARHQGRNDQTAFTSLARRFAERFATVAPAWSTRLQQGCTLEDYPAVIERLEWMWHSAAEVAQLLEVLLLRSGGMDNMPDLPACQDLLLLYGVVRERLGQEAPAPAHEAAQPWSFCHVEPPQRARQALEPAPPAADLPPMAWPDPDLFLPAEFQADAKAVEPRREAVEELRRDLFEFEPLQFDPPGLVGAGAGH